MTDRTIVLCVPGLANVRVVDLSGNHQITQIGWKSFADHLRWLQIITWFENEDDEL